MEDPEAVAVAGEKKHTTFSQPLFIANEKAMLVQCVESTKFKPCVEVMLRGVSERGAMDDKLNRV